MDRMKVELSLHADSRESEAITIAELIGFLEDAVDAHGFDNDHPVKLLVGCIYLTRGGNEAAS